MSSLQPLDTDAMAENLIEEEINRQVREQLNKEKVKLWLPPYTKEDGSKGEQPQVKLYKSQDTKV